METALKKDIYEHLTRVWSGTAVREVSDESVVPDAMPDVGMVVDAGGVLTLQSKETETGYVQLGATVNVTVLYMPEDGGALQSMQMTLPADIRMDAPAADAECRAVATMRIRSLEARTVNSRKLSVRAELEAEARCYRKDSLELASGMEEDGSAQLLVKTAEAMTVSDVREKTFVVTDEFQLPGGDGARTLLAQRVEAVVEDVKYVSGKVVFRGRARSELLLSGDEPGDAFAGRYETEFSQIMEVETDAAEALATVSLFLTGAYFDLPEYGQDQGRVLAELHFGAQCVCREKREVRYIADIYSNRAALVPRMAELPLVGDARPVTIRQTVAGRAEPPAGEGEVLSVTASVGAVTAEAGTVKTSVNIRLITRQRDGGFAAGRCRLTAEFTSSEIPEDAQLQNITVTVADVYCAGADVRATLQMDALAVMAGTLSCVWEVEEDPELWQAQSRVPSATLIRVEEGADLWPVARKYHSTVEAITAANEGRQAGLLLIPKGR